MADPVRNAAFSDINTTIRRLMQVIEQANLVNQELGVTDEDLALSNQVFDATRNQAVASLTSGAEDIARTLADSFASRGLTGSGFQAAQGGIVQRDLNRQLAQIISGTAAQQAQTLQQLPFQRQAASAQLLQAVAGASLPILDLRRQQVGIGGEFRNQQRGGGIGGALGTIGGSIVGGLIGGPGGAAAGGQVGGQIGG